MRNYAKRTKLVQARYCKGWSQEEAAEQLGVTRVSLSQWERGITIPYPANVQRLCEIYEKDALALDLSMEQIKFKGEMGTTGPDLLKEFVQDDLLHYLIKLVWSWPHRDMQFHELQVQIVQTTEDYTMKHESDQQHFNRREAMRRLALLPIEMWGLTAFGTTVTDSREEILKHCAAGVTACWYLRKGKDLLLASSVLLSYIPTLQALTEAPQADQRKAAADLLVQCYLLKATLARHVEGSDRAIYYAKQAELYSELAENAVFHVLALRTHASIYYYANQWTQALQMAEKAQYLLENAPGIPIPRSVHSYIYAGLATYQAHYGQKPEALISLKKAHRTFSAQSSHESAPIWVDHNHANLLLNDGMTHFHLGLQREALQAFAQIDTLPQKTELLGVETLINQVMAEIHRDDKTRDMDWCIDYWSRGIEGAKLLKSEQRFHEAFSAYTAMCAAWPGEQRLKDLRDLLVHW